MSRRDIHPVSIFKLLADEKRYRAVMLLCDAKHALSVTEIARELRMSHSGASHLLGVLHERGIVVFKRDGREMYYALGKTPQARKIIKAAKSI
jgi:DNA-binding transcriptional ArsR family regulator